MLDAMRRGTKSWIAKTFLVLLAASFGVWGIGDIVRGPQDPAVAEAGSVPIRLSVVQNEYRRSLEGLRRMTGGQFNEEQARALGLLDQTIDTLVVRALMAQESGAIGIGVSDAAVLQAITANDNFRDQAGVFNRFIYESALRELGFDEASYVARLRADLATNQIIGSLVAGLDAPTVVVDTLHAYREERRVALFATLSPDDVGEMPAPDEGEVQQHYTDNEAQFTAPELRRIAFLTLRPGDLLDEVRIPDEDVREEYELRRDELTVLPRRDIDLFVLADRETAATARRRIDGGEDFFAVGAELTGNRETDMRLGMVVQGELVPEAGEAAFAAAVGVVASPVETPFGWYLVRVNSAEAGYTPSFEDIADEIRLELQIEKASQATWEMSGIFEDERAAGATLEEAARAIGLTTETIAAVDRFGRDGDGLLVEGLPTIAEFLGRAFSQAPRIESDLAEAPGNIFYAFRVDAVIPPALRPLDEVREAVIDGWRKARRGERALAIATELAERAAGGGLAAAAAEMAITVTETAAFTRDGRDLDPALTAAAATAIFALGAAEATGPIATAGGGHAVAELSEIVAAGENLEARRQSLARQLDQGYRIDVFNGFEGDLRQRYGVSVNTAILELLYQN